MKSVFILAAVAVFALPSARAADPSAEIVALELRAMDGWLKGDPGPQLAITDPSITLFHVVGPKRIDGADAVKAVYEPYRGMPLFDRYEMRDPKVQLAGDAAVLSYQLVRHAGSAVTVWNGTQVYQKTAAGWRVIHTHWSEAKEQ
jgi:hypothetical protein